jgi:hypothetical protein
MTNRPFSFLVPFVGCIAAATACTSTPAEPAGTTESAYSAPSYPIHVEADPQAEARTRAALTAIAPNATLWFSRARGTLSSVGGLDLSLGSCPRGRSTAPMLRALVAAHADVFQIDPKEWATDSAPSCESVSTEGEWVSWPRATYGGAPMKHDVFALRIRRLGLGVVRLEGAAGTYLPPASAATRDAMAATPPISSKTAETTARETKLPYQLFSYCIPGASGSYLPRANDTFAIESSAWRYDETATGVDLVERTRATLRVDTANVTPELVQSNANCPSYGVAHVGWVLTFDTPKSSLLESTPGIDCVVCTL